MRKFFYILLGLILAGGALATFGARQYGWQPPGMSRSDEGFSSRSFERRDSVRRDRSSRGRRDDSSWLSFESIVDLLNILVGIVGIVLTISGMRMQRNAMQMSMRGRD